MNPKFTKRSIRVKGYDLSIPIIITYSVNTSGFIATISEKAPSCLEDLYNKAQGFGKTEEEAVTQLRISIGRINHRYMEGK